MDMECIHLKILLPMRVFADFGGVKRIVAESGKGSFGIWPHRLDCVAVLAPGIFIYETESGGETYVAVDEGVLVKTGLDVIVSVRNAIRGEHLETLRETVEREFLQLGVEERDLHASLARLESDFVRRYQRLKRN
jgi:F-type H+-transporting ATPase subunit epsilon